MKSKRERRKEVLEKYFCDWETYQLRKGLSGTNMIIDQALSDLAALDEVKEREYEDGMQELR